MLNLPYFISSRISKADKGSFSRSIHRIAIASVGLGLAVMLISFLILEGFKDTISQKVYSFSGHLQVSKYVLNSQMLEEPIGSNVDFYANQVNYPYIKQVHRVAYKGGLLKTDEDVQGVMLKGIGADYDSLIFAQHLISGRFLRLSDTAASPEIMISKKMARLLRIQLLDKVTLFFIQNPPRFRRLDVVGIYDTGLEDFDDKVIIGDLKLIQRLNDWGDSLVGGYEVFVHRLDQIEAAENDLFERADEDLMVQKVSDKFVQLFDWLQLLNRNVLIFLALILFVACFNMISIVFILIMERTRMIGLLKALGANNRTIRQVFIYTGMILIGKGLFWGNVIGLGFGVLQGYFHLIPLDPENYYMAHVPISWNWKALISVNVLVFLVVSAVLIMPTVLIAKLSPVKAMKFD